jgi:hypothetical protein
MVRMVMFSFDLPVIITVFLKYRRPNRPHR